MNFSGPLEDRLAIRELNDQYCDATMTKDVAMWAETWAEDAEWVRRDTTFRGREAIVADARKVIDSYSSATFFCNLGSTHVEGHRATGRCHLIELFFFGNGPKIFFSFYEDEYVKRAGRWFFQRRTFTLANQGSFRFEG